MPGGLRHRLNPVAQPTAIVVLLLVAVIAANLPWLSERIALVGPVPECGKREWCRLSEWLALYVLVGLLGMGLERRSQGTIHEQGWEFFVVTLCLFAVAAVPGFIYHHDLRRHIRRYRRRSRR